MGDCIKYWVWLSSIPGVGTKKRKQLIDYFARPERIWDASEAELRKVPFMTLRLLENILNKKVRDDVNRHLEVILREKIKVVTLCDEGYPYYLKNTYDPPVALFVKGEYQEESSKMVAIVGSRRATSYGLSMAEDLGYQLASLGITVVSGMARGVDSFAHAGALKAGGKTTAVLGCGIDIVYPSENKRLMQQIIQSGYTVSEYIPGVPPLPHHFPARNRIISGLSVGVIVIEASERSGSLITANLALEQGREVFAVPGNANSWHSKGTNQLIKEGAKMVTSVEDVLEELSIYTCPGHSRYQLGQEESGKPASGQEPSQRVLEGLDSQERSIAECLVYGPLHIDRLAQQTGLGIPAISSVLMILELKGLVEQMPGKMFKANFK